MWEVFLQSHRTARTQQGVRSLMSNVPNENPNKYGTFDGNGDEFYDLLNHGTTTQRDRPSKLPNVPASTEVDETFLRTLRDSVDKYGKG